MLTTQTSHHHHNLNSKEAHQGAVFPPSPPDLQTTKPQKVNSDTGLTDREEDVILFTKYVATQVFDENGKLCASDKKLRNNLADRNCKLVTYVVNKFYNKKVEHKALREDLLQEGSLGLLSAIDRFNPTLGFRFSTYATLWIKQSISNYLLSQDPRLHIPSHIRTAQNKVLKLMREKGMEFSDLIDENAKELGVTEKMLNSINASLKSKWVSSMEDPISTSSANSGDDCSTLKDILLDENNISCDSQTDYNSLINIVKRGLATLTEREQNIILLRYDVIQDIEPKQG